MMTDQEAFDHVYNSLVEQGEPSHNRGVCRYRTRKDGKVLKCAAGHLILDEDYFDHIEGKLINAVVDATKLQCDNLGLVVAMQLAHDRTAYKVYPEASFAYPSEYISILSHGFREVAMKYHLNYSKVRP